LNQDFQNLAFIINGTPKVVGLTVDFHEHLVQMPPATWAWSSAINPSGILFAELKNPAPDAFIGNVQTTFCEKVFHIAKAQCETEVQPDCVLDNLCWKSVSFIGNLCHAITLTPLESLIQRVNLSMPQRDLLGFY
jgi:hypothetical protein